jgi:hypothetical protein
VVPGQLIAATGIPLVTKSASLAPVVRTGRKGGLMIIELKLDKNQDGSDRLIRKRKEISSLT